MAANLRLSPHNHHDDATLSEVGTSVADFGPMNTQSVLRDRTLRGSAAGYTLRGVLDESRSASCLGIFRHALWGGTVQLLLYSDAAWSTEVYDSTALAAESFTPVMTFDFGFPGGAPWRNNMPFAHWMPGAVEFRSYEIVFDGTPSAGYFGAGRIFLGSHYEFSCNPDYGAPLSWDDNTDSDDTFGGSQRTNMGEQVRKWTIELNCLNENEFETMVAITEWCGMGRDFMISLFPDDDTTTGGLYTLNAKFTSLGDLGRQISRLTKRLTMREL